MSDAEWAEIVEAWAKWVRGDGPYVQYKVGSKWYDWTAPNGIDRWHIADGNHEWRIKPQPIRSRQVYRTSDDHRLNPASVVIWFPGQNEPKPPTGWAWLGDWLEVPEK
jgi:hypothetical protein